MHRLFAICTIVLIGTVAFVAAWSVASWASADIVIKIPATAANIGAVIATFFVTLVLMNILLGVVSDVIFFRQPRAAFCDIALRLPREWKFIAPVLCIASGVWFITGVWYALAAILLMYVMALVGTYVYLRAHVTFVVGDAFFK